MTDGSGNPVCLVLSPGNQHDSEAAFVLLEEIPDGAESLLADKGYDSDLLRSSARARGLDPVIPGRKNRKEEIIYDKLKYKGRHVVENKFCDLKQFRSIATRFEKLSRNFLSMVVIGCILCWVKL